MKHLTAAVVVFVVVVVFAAQVGALECMPVPLKTAVATSEIVLVGQVEKARFAIDPQHPGSTTHYIATVRVKALWKGSTPTTIELHQPYAGGGMDLHQTVGATYLFFLRQLSAARPLDHPTTRVTSGYTARECITKQIPSSYDLTDELGKGHPPAP